MSSNVRPIIIGLIVLTFTFVRPAIGEELGLTLCSANEDVYFSCPVAAGKIVSVCASDNTSPVSGYVQYRYGTPEKIEMVYPHLKTPPKGKLVFVSATEGSVTKDIIKFRSGEHTYIVAQAAVNNLSVIRGDSVVLRKTCEEGGYAFVSRAARKGIESVPKSSEDFR